MNNNYTVYMHKNKINGKKYVGITCTTLRKRWRNGYGYKRNQYFWNAIQKYGWDNFEHSVIAIRLSKDKASEMEKMLIREWDLLDGNKGYNIAEGGSNGYSCAGKTEEEMKKIREKMSESQKGKTLSDETRKKISENHAHISGENHPMYGQGDKLKGEKNGMYGKTGANCPNSIPVIAFTDSGSYYKEFACARDAGRELGACNSHISQCAKGKRKSAGKITINGKKEKLIWKYKE